MILRLLLDVSCFAPLIDKSIPKNFITFTIEYYLRHIDFTHYNSLPLNNLVERVMDSQGKSIMITVRRPKNKIFPPSNSA
jgi:hypothetical protein